MLQTLELKHQIQGAIAVIDFGGQYAHLIASKIRRLGAYSEILLPDDFLNKNRDHFYKGIILSGGPSSVYEKDSPTIDLEILKLNVPILGICYGHQFLMHKMGGRVAPAKNREYGKALLNLEKDSVLLQNIKNETTVWMSHGDEVIELPDGFLCVASTEDCKYAVVENKEKKIYGLQFHPEVSHTEEGNAILKNFIKICGLEGSWDLKQYLEHLLQHLKKTLKNKKVFFLVSGGVDSTVAFTILGKVLDKHHLYGMLVDTGFLRYKEADRIYNSLKNIDIELHIEDASEVYYKKLKNIYDPEEKRNIIGNLFVDVQQNVLKNLSLNADEWLLGQGTIYPDTIESGSTKFSHTIKTHHNRVEIIQNMLEKGLIVEPLKDLYKDEVREIGRLLSLPDDIIYQHPFPGPGLAVRCLCNDNHKEDVKNITEELSIEFQNILNKNDLKIYQLPIKSVGVQGDQRSYAHPAVIVPENYEVFYKNFEWEIFLDLARKIPNQIKTINRVILYLPKKNQKFLDIQLKEKAFLEPERIQILQIIDEIVNRFTKSKNIYYDIWQNPVVLLPLINQNNKESIVLRPVCSTDAMTASIYEMKKDYLIELSEEIYKTNLISYLFYDLTTKPPGTIEWE